MHTPKRRTAVAHIRERKNAKGRKRVIVFEVGKGEAVAAAAVADAAATKGCVGSWKTTWI
jgi:molybdenum cofactor biosynthesis enzyme